MPDLPTIGIIITVKSRARALATCLAAIARQTYPSDKLELRIVSRVPLPKDAIPADCAHLVRNVSIIQHGSRAKELNAELKQLQTELVAFLDADAVPERSWAANFRDAMASPSTGGCQGGIESTCSNPLLNALTKNSGAHSRLRLPELSADARWSAYPTLNFSNCILRKSALARAGMLDERLPLGEIDLCWRIVFCGYQLNYCEDALVRRQMREPVSSYLHEYVTLGKDAAITARKYSLRSGRSVIGNTQHVLHNDAVRAAFNIGMRNKNHDPSVSTVDPAAYRHHRESFRLPFAWGAQADMRLTPNMVHWRCGDRGTYVVNLVTKNKHFLAGKAEFIFGKLLMGTRRTAIVPALTAAFDISEEDAFNHVDEFVDHMIQEDIIERIPLAVPRS